ARQREEAALGDRLRTPGDALAAGEQPADERVRLQLLEQVVDGERGVAVVEADDHAQRDHALPHRVDERAAELAVAGGRAERPAHRVDHAVERLCDLPDLLDAEGPHLRVLALQCEALDRRAGEVTLGALGEHGDARDDVRSRLEVRELLTVPAAPLVAGANAADDAIGDEQPLGGRLRQDRRSPLLRPLAEPAAEPRERDDVIAGVPHRRRRRDPERALRGQEVDALVRHLAVRGHVLDPRAAAEEAAQGAWVHDGAREEVRAGLLALLEQLAEPDRAGEPGRAGADDQDPDLDPLARRIRRRGDRVRRGERRRVVGRPRHPEPFRWRTSCVSFGTSWWRSPTTPRSANSKIGAFGSLLIATIVPEPCIPTLCWIAPEIPQAT